MQVNIAPLQVIDFQRYFPHDIGDWKVKAFFEEFDEVNFGFAIFEDDTFVVVVVSFGFLLGAED